MTCSASMVRNARSGEGDGNITARPPAKRAPRMPGHANGKLWLAGSVPK